MIAFANLSVRSTPSKDMTVTIAAPLAARQARMSARDALRNATRGHHDAMEAAPTMAALLGAAPDARDVARAIMGQLSVIAPVEDSLRRAAPDACALFADYVPRAPLARADLARLPATPTAPAPRRLPRLASPEAWLGFRYVMEGASLGGALIHRRLAVVRPALPPLGFFDPLGERRGDAWRRFCGLLDARLPDAASRAEAARAAAETFDAIRDAFEETAA
jgi:heme oxygenase